MKAKVILAAVVTAIAVLVAAPQAGAMYIGLPGSVVLPNTTPCEHAHEQSRIVPGDLGRCFVLVGPRLIL